MVGNFEMSLPVFNFLPKIEEMVSGNSEECEEKGVLDCETKTGSREWESGWTRYNDCQEFKELRGHCFGSVGPWIEISKMWFYSDSKSEALSFQKYISICSGSDGL